MYFVVVTGPAGSGKSHLVDALSDWLESNEVSVARVNMDPAAEWLPYEPDVDVRSYVDARAVMQRYKLGPNGALVAAVDMLVEHAHELRSDIEATGANYVVLDTPGQMELFAFRETGPYVLRELVSGYKAVNVFLMDAVMVSSPRSLSSVLFLAMATRMRLELPQVNAVSKADLLDEERMEEIAELANDPGALYRALVDAGVDPETAEASMKALEALMPEGGSAPAALRFVSAASGYGVDDLYAAVQQVLAGGEDFYTEEGNPRL